MERISHPGNKDIKSANKTGGFIMLDALLSVFIAGIFLLSICGASALQSKVNAKVSKSAARLIEDRNNLELERMEDHE